MAPLLAHLVAACVLPTGVVYALLAAVTLSLIGLASALISLRGVNVRLATEAQAHLATEAGLRTDLECERGRLGAAHARLETAIADGAAATARLSEAERRAADWETAEARQLQAAKAAMLATARELSGQLLDDHKRESEAAKRDAEERVRRASDEMLRQVETIGKTVAALNREVEKTSGTVDVVWRALTTPGGAGRTAEIGLENTLKAFGLERGRDFVIQPTIDGGRLRPDAIVFLPGETLLVVDSKASKFVVEIAAADARAPNGMTAAAEGTGSNGKADAQRGLARTMNQHLRGLIDRGYRAEIIDSYRASGRAGDIRRILTVMYLPSEAAVDTLKQADTGFLRRATDHEIVVAGPAALACLIGFARVQIDHGRRRDNQERIVAGAQALLDAVGVVVEHAEKLGRGLKTRRR